MNYFDHNCGKIISVHGEPDAGKLARPVRREVDANLLPKGSKAASSYSTQDGWNPAWFGDQALLPHVWTLLGRREIRVKVVALPLVTVHPGENRKQLAARVEAMMMAAGDQALREMSQAQE